MNYEATFPSIIIQDMGASQTFTIGNRYFTSKTALESEIKTILHNSGIGKPLPAESFEFISNLFLLHPRYSEKIGVGVREIIVLWDEVYGRTKCFWIVRHDGTKTDFSYPSCIQKDRSNEAMKDFRAAARRAIDPQIAEYRDRYIRQHKDETGRFPCEKTGVMLSRKEEHVDHRPPMTFDKIVRDFLELNKLDVSTVQFNGYGDGEIVTEFKDDELRLLFAAYHKEVAVLRVISKIENLQQSRK